MAPADALFVRDALARRDGHAGGPGPGAAAAALGAGRATGYRWWARYTSGGWVGLRERPSTPQRQPRRLSPAAEAEILAARQRSGAGPVTLGALLGRPASTVGKVLRRLGHSRRPRAGWQHVHVAVDDHSQLAYAEVRPSARRGDWGGRRSRGRNASRPQRRTGVRLR